MFSKNINLYIYYTIFKQKKFSYFLTYFTIKWASFFSTAGKIFPTLQFMLINTGSILGNILHITAHKNFSVQYTAQKLFMNSINIYENVIKRKKERKKNKLHYRH